MTKNLSVLRLHCHLPLLLYEITRILLLSFRLFSERNIGIVIQNGLLSSLPHVVSYFGAVMSCELADFLRRHKIFSTTVTRKLFQCICMFPVLRRRSLYHFDRLSITEIMLQIVDCFYWIVWRETAPSNGSDIMTDVR